jgi:hypothetical protein
MNKIDIDSTIEKAQTNRQQAHAGFLKELLLCSCTLLGIHATLGNHYTSHLGIALYHSANIALLLCILLYATVVWYQVREARILEKKTYQSILDRMDGKTVSGPSVTTPKIIRLFDHTASVLFVVGLFLIVLCQFFE